MVMLGDWRKLSCWSSTFSSAKPYSCTVRDERDIWWLQKINLNLTSACSDNQSKIVIHRPLFKSPTLLDLVERVCAKGEREGTAAVTLHLAPIFRCHGRTPDGASQLHLEWRCWRKEGDFLHVFFLPKWRWNTPALIVTLLPWGMMKLKNNF